MSKRRKYNRPVDVPGVTVATDNGNNCADDENSLYQHQKSFFESIPDEVKDNFFCTNTVDPQQRAHVWMEQADIGENLVNRYSWATPDSRAIRILKHFSPMVEIGCGSNAYWSKLMQLHGIDVMAFDAEPLEGGLIKSKRCRNSHHGEKVSVEEPSNRSMNQTLSVQLGGPDVLSSPKWKSCMFFY